MSDEIKIAYLCDKKACNPCPDGECQHTLDINHAASFEELASGRWIEKLPEEKETERGQRALMGMYDDAIMGIDLARNPDISVQINAEAYEKCMINTRKELFGAFKIKNECREDNEMTKTRQIFNVGDQVFCPEDGIRGTVRAAYTPMGWGEVLDVMSSEGKIIYASPSKNWMVRKI